MASGLNLEKPYAVGFEGKTVVGVTGFEPAAPASRRQCSTRLSYTPTKQGIICQAGISYKRRKCRHGGLVAVWKRPQSGACAW